MHCTVLLLSIAGWDDNICIENNGSNTVIVGLFVVVVVLRPTGEPIRKCIRKTVCPAKVALEDFIRGAYPIRNIVSECGAVKHINIKLHGSIQFRNAIARDSTTFVLCQTGNEHMSKQAKIAVTYS